jgi:large subunit ribosomal protein L24
VEKIRKGDDVVVLVGRDKGKRGSVVQILDESKILIQGINRVKKHTKPNPMKGEQGGIVEKEMPIHRSNVALFNPITSKGDRVGIKVLEVGRRVRYFRSSGELVKA